MFLTVGREEKVGAPPFAFFERWATGRSAAECGVPSSKSISRRSPPMNYRLEGFSVERLMHFLNALDRDIEIVIRKKPRSRRAARIMVTQSQLSSPG